MLLSWLKKIGIVVLELAVIAGLLLFVYEKKGFENPSRIIPALQNLAQQSVGELSKESEKQVFPNLENLTVRTFNWEYKGEKYSLTETLYRSVYEFYKAQPKNFSYSGELSQNWEEQYYGMFLNRSASDKSIATLASDLQALGKKHNLNEDQIVDLTLAFVQTIPYDDAKANNILAKTGNETMLYPYETLFEQAGVCSDKSLLATVLLREMGYGTAIFAYNDDNHMAIGIECPKNFSTYGSGYCYAETTSIGNKIGIIPTFDANSNKTVDTGQLADLDSAASQNAKLGQLGQVTMYQKTLGKQYSGIIQTQKITQEIESFKKSIENLFLSIQSQKKQIKEDDKKSNSMINDLEMYQKSQNIEKYNALAEKYNSFLENYKKDVKKYNESITLYNKTIARYNVLIKQ